MKITMTTKRIVHLISSSRTEQIEQWNVDLLVKSIPTMLKAFKGSEEVPTFENGRLVKLISISPDKSMVTIRTITYEE